MGNNSNNLREAAFPLNDEYGIGHGGFSKHEYAAIMIAKGLASKFDLEQSGNIKNVARIAYELSAEVLNQFE